MSLPMRIRGAAGLLVLGALANLFVRTQVTRCLGPLGRMLADSIRDGFSEPSVVGRWPRRPWLVPAT